MGVNDRYKDSGFVGKVPEEGLTEVARNALAAGASFEFIQQITGLDSRAIRSIQP